MFDDKQKAFVDLCKVYANQELPMYIWIGENADVGLLSMNGIRALMVKKAQEEPGWQKISEKIDSTDGEPNFWQSLQQIKDVVGEKYSQWRNTIFKKKATPKGYLPELYRELARLKVNGVISTNIDPFISAAYAALSKQDNKITEFTGADCEAFYPESRQTRPL